MAGSTRTTRLRYAEDADLAFKVRARGRSVVFQPMARVVHFEGATSGTTPGSGVKAHQEPNLQKLAARWRAELDSHFNNGEHVELAMERGVTRRVLVIDLCTPVNPTRARGSDSGPEHDPDSCSSSGARST